MITSRLSDRGLSRTKMSNGRHALSTLCLTLFSVGCNSQQPTVKPTLMANLHQTITGHSEMVWEVDFSSDGQYLASGSVDRTVKWWRWREGALAQTLTHSQGVTSIAFSPNGEWLASGSYDQTVKVWRVRDGVLERTLSGHSGTVWSVAFSPDGQRPRQQW